MNKGLFYCSHLHFIVGSMQILALLALLLLACVARYHREDESIVWVRCRQSWGLTAYVNDRETTDDCVTVLNNFHARGYGVVGHGAGAYHSEHYSWTLQKRHVQTVYCPDPSPDDRICIAKEE